MSDLLDTPQEIDELEFINAAQLAAVNNCLYTRISEYGLEYCIIVDKVLILSYTRDYKGKFRAFAHISKNDFCTQIIGISMEEALMRIGNDEEHTIN